MDHRSTVIPPAQSMSEGIQVDYAIFTSIRSPMGNGYQLAAASKGVGATEKAEIQRRSPSHNALCSNEAHAVGLSAYPLSTGRYVVALSRYGNREYSGRGGRCIETHLVILDDRAYTAFDSNPLRVQQSLVEVIGQDPVTRPPRQLSPLTLDPGTSRAGDAVTLPPAFGTPNDAERLTFLARWMLAKRPVIITGAQAPLSAMEWTLMTLPAGWRRGLALSAGIKFAIARQLHWVVLEEAPEDMQRLTSGHDIRAFSVTRDFEADPHPCDEWFHFIERSWRRNRFNEISRITARYDDASVGREDLSRIVAMYGDRDLARVANTETRARLHQTYCCWTAKYPLEEEVAREITELTREVPEDEVTRTAPHPDPARVSQPTH